MRKKYYVAVLLFITNTMASVAYGHGAVSWPPSRQYQCYQDGGFWSDAIPNAGCRASFKVSGAYPFQQWNEVSANPNPRSEQAAIMRAVPNGLLCAAGDPKKRGLDQPQNEGWKLTPLRPGLLDLTWELSQPHNPSFVTIYITKDSSYQNRELRWSDLTQLYKGTMPGPTGSGWPKNYIIPVTIPDINGKAIIFSIWQREDAGNEGFFNCSDVIIEGSDGGNQPAPQPGDEWLEDQPLVKYGIEPKPGDKVRFRLLGGAGEKGLEVIDINMPITAQNERDFRWAEELAAELNKSHTDYLMVGVKEHGQINYDTQPAQVYSNMVWVTDSSYHSALSIISAEQTPTTKPVANTPTNIPKWPNGIGNYQTGKTVVLGVDGKQWRCRTFPQGGWCNINAPAYTPGGPQMVQDPSAQAWEPVK